MIGSGVGARKCLLSTGSRRSTRQQMLTTVNTASNSSAVVPPSRLSWLLALDELPTKISSPTAIAVVNKIATHGVRRPSSTRPSTGGSTPCFAIP